MKKYLLSYAGVWLRGLTTLATLVGLGANSGGALLAGGPATDLSGPPVYSAKYGTRLPRVCSKVTSPPNGSQATALAQCQAEGLNTTTQSIILVTDLTVEMGSPRDFMPGADNFLRDIDTRAKVYPLRGQSTRWDCGQVNAGNVGKNCMTWPRVEGESTGQGSCWYTLFKEWKCTMSMGGPTWKANVPAPPMIATY